MPERPNVLLITVDDMNWDAVGAFGCPVEGTTPRIDELARSGVRFERGHVTIAVCQPSRSAMLTGRYPHRSGGEGFHHLRLPGVPILPDLLRRAGYRVGILGKVRHSTPYAEFTWDMTYDMDDLGHGRNPQLYHDRALEFMREASARGEPFFLMANSHDPHRPFYGNDRKDWYEAADRHEGGDQPEGGSSPHRPPSAAHPSRVFRPEEVTVPGFLPDLPEVRLEISEYYSSVRRADDTVGGILDALDEAGASESTLVIFLSDNGMAFPFAKTNCYLHSTRTPWIVRWPGHDRPGSVDREHFVSGIDIAPTVLDAAGLPQPAGMDGRSFLPLLRGEEGPGRRDRVFTQFHSTSARQSYPMRCVQTTRIGYIANLWSDGTHAFRNESQQGRTFAAMAASPDPGVAERVRFFLHRVPEELYDFERDPDALRNLIGDPHYRRVADELRAELETWMVETGDPALPEYRELLHRSDLREG